MSVKPRTDKHIAFTCSVKAMKDKMGPEGLLSSVLIFGEYSCFPVHLDSQIPQKRVQEGGYIATIARKEMGLSSPLFESSDLSSLRIPQPATDCISEEIRFWYGGKTNWITASVSVWAPTKWLLWYETETFPHPRLVRRNITIQHSTGQTISHPWICVSLFHVRVGFCVLHFRHYQARLHTPHWSMNPAISELHPRWWLLRNTRNWKFCFVEVFSKSYLVRKSLRMGTFTRDDAS